MMGEEAFERPTGYSRYILATTLLKKLVVESCYLHPGFHKMREDCYRLW